MNVITKLKLHQKNFTFSLFFSNIYFNVLKYEYSYINCIYVYEIMDSGECKGIYVLESNIYIYERIISYDVSYRELGRW